MSREWKIGDVAMVECSDSEWRQGVCGLHPNVTGKLVWRFEDHLYRHVETSTARPVVVIDPEDREQVERLEKAIVASPGVTFPARLQEALRSLVTEPEPEEPTGLGAVVRDGQGGDWVLVDPTLKWTNGGNWVHWTDLPRPVAILSPGWEPES